VSGPLRVSSVELTNETDEAERHVVARFEEASRSR
jgi:hypothetical protein